MLTEKGLDSEQPFYLQSERKFPNLNKDVAKLRQTLCFDYLKDLFNLLGF